MKIAAILNVHDYLDLVLDTLDSIHTWVTDDAIVLVDGKHWDKFEPHLNEFKDGQIFKGLDHGHYSSPFRNIALALKISYEKYPNHDWHAYTEYDLLFVKDSFKEDLKNSTADVIANDVRWKKTNVSSLFEDIVGNAPQNGCTMLGCCVFYRGSYIKELVERGILDRLIDLTKDLKKGRFPGYTGYAFEEFFFPTVAENMGFKVEQSGFWSEKKGWLNKKYLARFKPNIEMNEIDSTTAIIHPCKERFDDCSIRQFFAEDRKSFKFLQ